MECNSTFALSLTHIQFWGISVCAGKCIVLLLDGTWNDSETGDTDTNIVRLRELIIEGLDQGKASQSTGKSFVSERTFNNRPVMLYYDRGVGTGGFLDKYLGGALGAGLERGVRRAYRFLSNNFNQGDEVFIFGFSRGAYTARSLTGFIGAVGLLQQKKNNPINESKAWGYYRTHPKDRLEAVASELRILCHDQSSPLISCLGVFDTVGARGIPIRWFWRENRDLFEFHDVELSSVCKTNLHALAIDEHREAFQAAVWRRPKFRDINSTTEQVWFAGAHADIGGGNISYYDRTVTEYGKPPRVRKCLDDISLDWMIRRLKAHHPDFPLRDDRLRFGEKRQEIDQTWAVQGVQREARTGIYRLFPFAWRSIGNCSTAFGSWAGQRFVSQDRHAIPIGEMVHISALQRWGNLFDAGWFGKRYEPPNLRLALDRIDRTYSEQPDNDPRGPLHVVGWCGRRLEPTDRVSRGNVRELIDLALRRKTTADANRNGERK
jgi:hypothetical protein